MDTYAEDQLVIGHFETSGERDNLVLTVEVEHAVVDHVYPVLQDQIVDLGVCLVREGNLEVLIEWLVTVTDPTWCYYAHGGEALLAVV